MAQNTSSDGYRNARRLGGSTSFYKPPLTTPASVRRMAAARNMTADVRLVLSQAGISETADAVLATLSGANTAVKGGSCTDATPAPGVLVECDFPVGGTLDWMAYRPNIRRGVRTPGRIERFRWAGRRSFKAYLFRVANNNRTYTFVLPWPCGNLSLMSVQTVAAAQAPAPPHRATATTAASPPATTSPPPLALRRRRHHLRHHHRP